METMKLIGFSTRMCGWVNICKHHKKSRASATGLKATAWHIPLAIAEALDWAQYASLPEQMRGLFYWWTPDEQFLSLYPKEVVFPAHSATQWAVGNQSTMSADLPINKFASPYLASWAPEVYYLVQQFALDMTFLTAVMRERLLNPDLNRTRAAACSWLRANDADARRRSSIVILISLVADWDFILFHLL